jgi:hypothetical protein
MHKHIYICMYNTYYSNIFDLSKIWVMQDLQERDDCVSQGASVYSSLWQ